MTAIITMLTDFGTADGYVGEMKGILLSHAPGAVLVDVAHDLGPQDVEGARLALARYWRRYPAGTVHLVVVDPGVGGVRAALAVQCGGRYLVGPDNGVLSPALLHPEVRCVMLPVPGSASATFHGRDLFAPAAASLAAGATLEELGDPFAGAVLRRTPEAQRHPDGTIEGVVLTIDRFGNAVTNLVGRRGGAVQVAALWIAIRHTYADAEPGEPVAVIGSSGLVEIAVREGSAAVRLGIARGDCVRLRS